MTRMPLSRSRIVAAAAALADRTGLTGVSMRNVAAELGVEAMSLYHHIPNKDALLDELSDVVFGEIDLPAVDAPWRAGMTVRAASARVALNRHPWGLGLIESRRSPGPAALRHHNAVHGCLRRGGFSVRLAMHAVALLDAYVYGFVVSELSLPLAQGAEAFARGTAVTAAEHPYLVELAVTEVFGTTYRYADEFDYGLDLILDGLQARLAAQGPDAPPAG